MSQNRSLHRGERARLAINHAERADRRTAAQAEWRASVEPNVRRPGYERVECEPCVLCGVANFEDPILFNGVGTERDVALSFTDAIQADVGLEPLPVAVDQAHQRDRDIADQRRRRDQCVKFAFRGGVEDVQRSQCLQSF